MGSGSVSTGTTERTTSILSFAISACFPSGFVDCAESNLVFLIEDFCDWEANDDFSCWDEDGVSSRGHLLAKLSAAP